MLEAFSLKNSTIIVTGASSGIGRSIAILCNYLGASIILIGRDKKKLLDTKMQFLHPQAGTLFVGDIQQPSFFEQFETFLTDHQIKVHGLVHAAGISPTLPLRVITMEKMNQAIDTNLKSAISLARILCRPIIAGEHLSIVFVTSVMASVGASGKSLYSLTKGALVAASKSLAIEFAPKRIRFNTVSPGVVITPMSLSSVYGNDPAAMKAVESLHPLGFGQPEDIAYASAFLLSRASRWVTGTDLVIDGGYTAK
jgi:NAD(P)-dependent dehydrogenase (short-subunit alcohol dehydrogenase family)